MNNSNIDIKDLDKVKLLKAMWENQIVAGFFGGGRGPIWKEDAAAKAVSEYIDYYQGRAIKTDLSRDTVDPYLYDRDAGQGSLSKIVSELRSKTAN